MPPRAGATTYRGATMCMLRTSVTSLFLLFAAWVFGAAGAGAQPASFAPLVKAQRGKVVHIATRPAEVRSRQGERLPPFRFPEHRQGMGSGFIVSADGLIVTNLHVVSDSEEIAVILANGKRFEAVIVGTDPRTDPRHSRH